MRKCQMCRLYPLLYTWQPFGPDDNPRAAFTRPGSHYRGFPAIGVCGFCHKAIEDGKDKRFTYQGITFRLSGTKVHALTIEES